MASKRNVRRKSCTGKIKYSQAECAKVAERLRIQKRERIHHYHCPFCNFYHVGHIPKKMRSF